MIGSKEYWEKREKENLKKYLLSEKEYERELKEIYRSMQTEIQKDIESFYGRYASKEGISIADAKKRADELDIQEYGRKAKKYVEEKNFSKQANEEMRLYNMTMKVNRLELLKAQIGIELINGFDQMQKNLESELTDRTLEEYRRQAGILGDTTGLNVQNTKAIVNASFRNATFSDRIWMNQDLLRLEIAKELKTGMIQGKNPRVLAGNIQKALGASRVNAERLMRTELARVQIEAQKLSYEKNGIEKFTFICTEDFKVCHQCASIHDHNYLVKNMMPGKNAAPMHPNCRCSTVPYIPEGDYNKWLDGYKKHGKSFKEWKNRGVLSSVGKVSGKTKAPAKFVPAKTIEEAEEYLKRFVDDGIWGGTGISLKGISIDSANAINEALTKLFKEYDIGKLGGVTVPKGNTRYGKLIANAKAAYSPVTKSLLINKKSFKNPKILAKEINKEKQLIDEYAKNPKAFTFATKQAEAVAKASAKSGRATVPETVEDIINHEFGHTFEKEISQMDNYKLIKANMPKYAEKISGYATTEMGEYIAESFASYRKGENLIDPELRKVFDGLKKSESFNTLAGKTTKHLAKLSKNDIVKKATEKDMLKQTNKQLKNGIKSYKKSILKHKEKITNPKKYYLNWDDHDERFKAGCIKHWKKEIKVAQDAIDRRIAELESRGEKYE